MMNMDDIYSFLMEMDKLKGVYRRSFLSDQSRNENSAEHSWHLAMALLLLQDEEDLHIDIFRTMKMALVHDVCEIGAGDISVYDPGRNDKYGEEKEYLAELKGMNLAVADEIYDLWDEYEKQETGESRWVKVLDRLLPFCLNIATEGKSWKEQGIRREQVIRINDPIRQQAPEIFQWILGKIDMAVEKGWLGA